MSLKSIFFAIFSVPRSSDFSRNMSDNEIKVEQNVRVIVNLDSFISIDVFQRGYYQLKIRCYKKSKSPIGSKRVDGLITQIYPLDDSDLKGFLDFDKVDNPDKLSGSRSGNYEKCTIDHKICSWKCIKLSGVDGGSTIFLTRPFYIVQIGERFELKTGVCFELDSSYKLYESDYRQEDSAILDFELFFHSEKVPDALKGVSVQRKMMKIESLSTSPITRPVYSQIVFDLIYFSSLDVSIQSIPVTKRISKRLGNSNMANIPSPWSFKSIVKSIPSFYSIAVNDLEKVQPDSMDDIFQPVGIDLKLFLVCQIFLALHTSTLEKVWRVVSGLFDCKPS